MNKTISALRELRDIVFYSSLTAASAMVFVLVSTNPLVWFYAAIISGFMFVALAVIAELYERRLVAAYVRRETSEVARQRAYAEHEAWKRSRPQPRPKMSPAELECRRLEVEDMIRHQTGIRNLPTPPPRAP